MKKLLLCLLLLTSVTTFCQTQVKNSDTENFVGGSHGKLRVFCGYDFISLLDFQMYLQQDLQYSSTDAPMPKDKNTINMAFVKRISHGNSKLLVSFIGTTPDENSFIVKRCTITGPWSQVAEVFVKYWQTTYNSDEAKAGVVRYNGTDKVTFKTIGVGKTATITVDRMPK